MMSVNKQGSAGCYEVVQGLFSGVRLLVVVRVAPVELSAKSVDQDGVACGCAQSTATSILSSVGEQYI